MAAVGSEETHGTGVRGISFEKRRVTKQRGGHCASKKNLSPPVYSRPDLTCTDQRQAMAYGRLYWRTKNIALQNHVPAVFFSAKPASK
jgi:hypothetical protein